MDHLNYVDFQEHNQQIAVTYKLKAITYNPPHNNFEHVFPFFGGYRHKYFPIDMRVAPSTFLPAGEVNLRWEQL